MPTLSDVVVERLNAWGVQRIYGYSGDGINGLLGAIQRAEGPRFIQTRHEENAALMATGHAKFTGEVGVTLATQGPGAVHLLNGLYDAKLDQAPVVAIIGQQKRSALGSGYMQEVNLPQVFSDVAQYVQLVTAAEQIPAVIDRAFRSAITSKGPAVVILPSDLQTQEAAPTPHAHGMIRTSSEVFNSHVTADPKEVTRAARIFTEGQRIAFLVGRGAANAQEEVRQLAEKLGAGIATSLLGKPYVSEDLSVMTGTMGHLGSTASAYLLDNCDTLVIIGSNDPWTEFYPPPGQARAVQIDIDPAAIGNRYPVEVGLVGDAAGVLRHLLDQVPAQRRAWSEEIAGEVTRWHDLNARRARIEVAGINPERVIAELNPHLPQNLNVGIDVGSITYWYARQLKFRSGSQGHISGTLATMGCSVPYALAAKLANDSAPALALSGDGAMQMIGNGELVTVADLWQEWQDPRFIICVLNNGDLAEVSWEQREKEGIPRFEQSQKLPSFPYAKYANLLGLDSLRVTDPAQIKDAWIRAWNSDRPILLEFVTDRDVPLLPPLRGSRELVDKLDQALSQEPHHDHARELLQQYAEAELSG